VQRFRPAENIDPRDHDERAQDRDREPDQEYLRGQLSAPLRSSGGAPDADRAEAKIDHHREEPGQADDELDLAISARVENAGEIGEGEQVDELGRDLAAGERAEVREESRAAARKLQIASGDDRFSARCEKLLLKLAYGEVPFLPQ
jgi:hypothetical protein